MINGLYSALINGIPKIKHKDAIDVSTPHSLADLVAAVCSETEADGKITTHKGDASAHHIKTTVVTGNYTGTGGVAARQITTGMKCSLVIIMAGTDQVNRQCDVIPGYSVGHKYTTSPGHVGLASNVYLHASNGFVVGQGSTEAMNVADVIYRYWAISE